MCALDVLTSSSDPRALVVIDERDSELVHPTAGSIRGETCIAKMYTLGWRVPQPGVEAEGEGVTSQVARTIHCSGKESVSKQRVVPMAPPPAVQTSDSPRSPQPTRPHMLDGSSYGPQMAVTSIHPRFHRESCCRHLDGTELHQNDKACCPVRKLVSNRRVVPTAPTPAASTRCPPRSQHPTHSKMRYDPSDGPQMTVPSAPTRPLDGPCSHRSERAKPCQDGTVIRERSNANVNTELKLKTSSAILLNRSEGLDLPSPVLKEPNKHVGLDEWHQAGATVIYERSNKSVSHEAAQLTPLPLPWDPGNNKDLPGKRKRGRIARSGRRTVRRGLRCKQHLEGRRRRRQNCRDRSDVRIHLPHSQSVRKRTL